MSKKYKNKLFSYLDILRNEELFRLERFISSKFFNTPKEERLRRLFSKIRKAKPSGGKFSELNPSEFGAKPTDFSDLLKLVKRYIAFTQLEKDEQVQKRFLIEGLRDRAGSMQVELLINSELSKTTIDIQENYEHRMLLLEINFIHHIIHHHRHKKTDKVLQELMYSIDRYYALLKIHYAVSMLGRSTLNAFEFDYGSEDAIQSIVEKSTPDEYPLLHAWFSFWQFAQFNTRKTLEKHKTILFNVALGQVEKKQFFDSLINYIRQNTRYTSDFFWYEELHDIYERYFGEGIALAGVGVNQNKISPQHYINYRLLLMDLKLVQKANSFKEQYYHKCKIAKGEGSKFFELYDHIITTECKDIKALNRMERKLAVMREPDIYYRIIFEVIAIKTTYNCRNKTFTHKRERFRDYIRNQKKLGKEFKQTYLNFATLTRRLHNFQQKKINSKPLDASRLQGLGESIQTLPTIERIWLTEKFDELSK